MVEGICPGRERRTTVTVKCTECSVLLILLNLQDNIIPPPKIEKFENIQDSLNIVVDNVVKEWKIRILG